MKLTIACVANHEEQFRKAIGEKQKAEAKKELAAKRRQLTQAERRIEELDRLFKSIYEDNANGKLSDSRFQMLSDDYEQEEQAENSRLTFLMTLWEYSPRLYWMTCKMEKRHSPQATPFPENISNTVLWVPP